MIDYTNRTESEKDIIRKAYEFEIEAIENLDSNPNPYLSAIHAMGLDEALNEAIDLHYHRY